MPYKINEKLCPQDHACPLVDSCPVGAISQEGFGLPDIDAEICIECGVCEAECGKNAVYMSED